MKKFLNKIIYKIYHKELHSNYSGQGYIQGVGFSVLTTVMVLFGFKFISEIEIQVDSEWIRNLKRRMKEDDEQQLREKKLK